LLQQFRSHSRRLFQHPQDFSTVIRSESILQQHVGIALPVEAVIPFGDMSIILGSGGSKPRAFSIHGVTCAVMLVVGLLLIHAI
jgi:hypothetical protein